ncbi:MAG: RNA polymerase-binding protein DksA [Sinimarinibacterium sp.]
MKGALSKKAVPKKPAPKDVKKAPPKQTAPKHKPSGTKNASPAKPKATAAGSKKLPHAVPAPHKSSAKPTTPPPASKPQAPVLNKIVTKTAAKKTRTPSFDGGLSEDALKAMSDDAYMNDTQLEFFRKRLLQMRQEVLQREMDVKERLHEREMFADPADRATAEEEHWLDLRLRERESLLLHKIDDALRRIEAREYGYCEKTGDPIGIPRLLARPTATVCVDVKGQDERVEAQYRDR